MYDVIVIGAGIAGLTSAIYSARAGRKTLVVAGKTVGGQIINSPHVENYPGFASISGYDLINNLLEQVKSFNVDIVYEDVTKLTNDKKIITESHTYETKAIIIATGLENKKLGLENEDKFMGLGISICATCDGNFFRNQEVAIVGGGNTAIEDALYLSNLCKTVHLIHRRDEFRAEKIRVDEVMKTNNIKLHLNDEIVKINGNDSLESIELKSGDVLNISGLFIAIGQKPNSKIYEDIVKTTDGGYIVSNEECTTSCPFIFVAGDCRDKKVRQLITAASDGAIAALSASNYIEREC